MTFEQLKELTEHISAIARMGCFDIKIENDHEDSEDASLLDTDAKITIKEKRL